MIDRVVFSRFAAVAALLASAACTREAVAPGDPHGTINGQITLDNVGVEAVVLVMAVNFETYVLTTDANGNYSFDLPAGDWHLQPIVLGAGCSDAVANVAEGTTVTNDLGCTSIGGSWTKSHHQITGTCNDPVADFTVPLLATVLTGPAGTSMKLAYDDNENTAVQGPYEEETSHFDGESGKADAGGGVRVQEKMSADIERQSDGTLGFIGTSTVEFSSNGVLVCTKVFEITGTRTGN